MAPVLWKAVAGGWQGKQLVSIDLNMSNVYSLHKDQRATHIHRCRQKERAKALIRLHSDLVYCFQCFAWFVKEEWIIHCRQHLDSISSRRCGSITYCHSLVRPAYCPFCLGNETLSADKRLQAWTRDADLMPHLEEHISKAHWPSTCPHPLCDVQMQDETSFWYHLSDAHNLRRDNIKGRKRGWKAVTFENNDDMLLEAREQSETSYGVEKKQKSTRLKEMVEIEVIEYSPPHSSKLSPTSANGNSPRRIECPTTPDLTYTGTSSPDSAMSCPTENCASTRGDYDGDDSPSRLDFLEVNHDMNGLIEESQ